VRARREPKNKAKAEKNLKGLLRNQHVTSHVTCAPRPPTLQRHVELHVVDLVIYSKFHRNPFMGFGAPVGRNLPFFITLSIGFYNSLYNRASRDVGPPGTVTNAGPINTQSPDHIEPVTQAVILIALLLYFLFQVHSELQDTGSLFQEKINTTQLRCY